MIIVRPHSCHYCGNGYYGLSHAVDYANSKGFDVTDLADDQANKGPIYDALNTTDAGSAYMFGHGNSMTYTADAEQPVFSAGDDLSILSGRDIYLMSCLTALVLGTKIVQAGANHYAGYNISWTWQTQGGTDGDPYDDYYAKCYWESANELWVAICDGETFENAVNRCIAKYTEWINFWENSGDPSAVDQITWLLHDRDGLCMLTPAQPFPPSPAIELDWNILAPTVLVLGMIVTALWPWGKKKPRSRTKG